MDVIICPECGASNPVEATVCESCSADLNAVRSVMDTANNHYNEALALAHGGRLDEAIGQLEAALALTAQNANYHNLLGTLYAQKGLFSEAIRAWERCLELDPEMEKAYNNIDKARRMEEEAYEEQQQRPFLLAAIGGGVAAAVFFILTIYFGVGSYFKANEIADLNDMLDEASTDVLNWKTQFQSISKVLPAEGINGLLDDIKKQEALAEERAKQVENTKEQYQRIVDRRQEMITNLNSQIQELRAKGAEKDKEIQKVNQLQSVINSNKNQIARFQSLLKEKNELLEAEQARTKDLRDKLVVAQDTSKGIREDKEKALANLQKENERIVESIRNEKQELMNQIADLERRNDDMIYAGKMVVEAIKNLEANQFELAYQNAQTALQHAPKNPAALYMQKQLQDILNDPFEQERRRQDSLQRKQQREEQLIAWVQENLEKAENASKNGDFDRAIDLADRASKLAKDDNKVEQAKTIIGKAQEEKAKIAYQILEAERKMESKDLKQAEKILRAVLKRNPQNEKAQMLLQQLTAPADSSTE